MAQKNVLKEGQFANRFKGTRLSVTDQMMEQQSNHFLMNSSNKFDLWSSEGMVTKKYSSNNDAFNFFSSYVAGF